MTVSNNLNLSTGARENSAFKQAMNDIPQPSVDDKAKISAKATHKIASATVVADPTLELGVGVKTGLSVLGQKAGVEVLAIIPFSTFQDITYGRSFNLGMKAKIELSAGPIQIVGQFNGVLNFQNTKSAPEFAGEADIGIMSKDPFGSGAMDAILGGFSFKVDKSGFQLKPELSGEYKKSAEKTSETSEGVVESVFGAEGAAKWDARGNTLNAIKGAIGGSASGKGEYINLTAAGKVFLNLSPMSIQVISPNGVKLMLKNDSRNGIWTLKTPDGKVIGKFDLPQLTAKLQKASVGVLENMFKTVPELQQAAQTLGLYSPQPSARDSKLNAMPSDRTKAYKLGEYIGIPNQGQLVYAGTNGNNERILQSRTTKYQVPAQIGPSKDEVRKWAIDAVKHDGMNKAGLYPVQKIKLNIDTQLQRYR